MRDTLYSVRGPKTLFEMTWEEVSERLKETDMVLMVLGSTEQHGPHLPLGTDTMQTVEACKRVVLQLETEGLKAVVAAPIPFGMCSYHMAFPGTIALQPTTFLNLSMDVCRSLYRHGFRRFVFPLGHGGNFPMMQVVAQQLVDETEDAETLVLNWLPPMASQYSSLLKTEKTEGHSGGGETSRMLATHPELVESGRARAYYSKKAEELETPAHPLMGGGVMRPARSMRDATPFGSIGDPGLASAEAGEKIYQIGVDWLCAQIRREFG